MSEYTGENYKKYFLTEHWKQLKSELIWSNPKAKCFCCGSKVKEWITFHHTRYDNLFHEKLYRDGYLLCYKCHRLVHKLLCLLWRYPLRHRLLVWHVRLLKSIKAIQQKRFRLFLLYFSTCLVTGVFNLLTVTLKVVINLLYHTLVSKKPISYS